MNANWLVRIRRACRRRPKVVIDFIGKGNHYGEPATIICATVQWVAMGHPQHHTDLMLAPDKTPVGSFCDCEDFHKTHTWAPKAQPLMANNVWGCYHIAALALKLGLIQEVV